MRKFSHTVLIVFKRANRLLTDPAAGAAYAIRN